jgi:predicted nucleic acid-binding protein
VIVVSNTSPITSLAAIGYLNLLHDIYGTIIIPVAVYQEMTGLGYAVPGTIEVQTLSWIEKRELENRLLLEELQKELHRGESETIALAISSNADRVIIDENPGRKKAISLGLNVKYLSKINYTYLTPLLPLAPCLLPIFTRKLILHDYLLEF